LGTPRAKRIQTLDGLLSVPEGVKADSFAHGERGVDQNGNVVARTLARCELLFTRAWRNGGLASLRGQILWTNLPA